MQSQPQDDLVSPTASVVVLLHVSYQFRHEVLGILSNTIDIDYIEEGIGGCVELLPLTNSYQLEILTLKGKNSGNQLSMSLDIWSLRWGWMLRPTFSYNIFSAMISTWRPMQQSKEDNTHSFKIPS